MTKVSKTRQPSRFRVGLIVCAAYFSQLPGLAQSESTKSIHWETGAEFRRQLQAPVHVTWQGIPLRDSLQRFSEATRVAIFLDRRVDPNLRISLQTRGAPLLRALEGLAKRLKLGTAEVGPVVYLGPRFTADRLTTLAVKHNEELAKLPKAQADAWRRRATWSWPRLSEPRELLSDLAQQNGLKIQNLDIIPHDLWPQASLPPLTLAERLTLFLAGFQRSYSFDRDNNIVLIRFPKAVSIQRQYRLHKDIVVDRLRTMFPQANIEVAGDKVNVRSTVEDHNAIRQLIGGKSRDASTTVNDESAAGLDNQRFRLRILNREFAEVIHHLRQHLELEIEIPDDSRVDSGQLISVDVEDATIDELMEAVLEQVDMTHERNGRTVTVRRRS